MPVLSMSQSPEEATVHVRITVDGPLISLVIDELNRRRGRITKMDRISDEQIAVFVELPLSTIPDLANSLNEATIQPCRIELEPLA